MSLYFPLGKRYQPSLEKYVAEMNDLFGWKPNVLQCGRSWFKDGLNDRAITRDLDWGIKGSCRECCRKSTFMFGSKLFLGIFLRLKNCSS
ncbi:MAG: class I tRNA ligase family protein [Ignavibacteriales bacterium]|nr:class I tRNA ligase family protein [Ignavibacteriales bacterium]